MAIGKNTVIILSLLLVSQCLSYAWTRTHSKSTHILNKRSELDQAKVNL